MRTSVFSVLIATIVLGCSGSKFSLEYGDYSQINPLLTIGANSIVRYSDITLNVLSTSEAIYTEKKAITILNRDHNNHATVVVWYDQLSKVNSINANVIDRNGNVVRSYSTADANDYSAVDGVSFFTDNRVKVLDLSMGSFPYTIEYEYQKTYKSTLNLPNWFPHYPEQSVESATFTIIDDDTGVRYHNENLEQEPQVDYLENGTSYSWSLNNELATELEPLSPSYREFLPFVNVAPGAFEISGSRGNASSWKDFGAWYYELGKDTRELPEAAQREVDELIAGIEDEGEIVATLFNYLQEKNRYVSIQLGIGGWQPFPAEYVFENSYGDCKALTNYMQAILLHAGITAEPVLISAGGSSVEMIEEFPGHQFNHVILRVTLSDGTVIWLECTSKYLPIDNLGDGKSKKALLITENGGEVIETPAIEYTENKQQSVHDFAISESGTAVLSSVISNSGSFQSRVLYQLLSVADAEKVEWIEESIPVSSRRVTESNFEQLRADQRSAVFSYEANLPNFANVTAKRMYVPVNKLNQWQMFAPDQERRTQPIQFRNPFMEVDSVRFNLPENYELEFVPQSREVETTFATFSFQIQKLDGNTILFERVLEMKEDRIEPEQYDELKQFLDEVRVADSQQLVLLRTDVE